jgi:hypothetical protein
MYLLGAGASADADIPLASQLTQKLTELVNAGRGDSHDGRSGANPTVLPDIERVVSAVELLSKRGDLEVAPFITAWDSTVDSLELARLEMPHRLGGKLRVAIQGSPRHGPSDHDVEKLLTELIDARTSPKRVDVFHQLYDELIRGLIHLLGVEPAAVKYLEPLAESAGSGRVDVATLNYDLTIETACASVGIEWGHGVDGWGTSGLLTWPDNGVHLIKLHGSIDWRYEPNAGLTAGVEPSTNRNAALVFGRREKLRAAGPFLQLFEHFRATLRGHTDLVVVGYAFADEHVNKIIDQWMAADAERRILLVEPYVSRMPSFPPKPQVQYLQRFATPPSMRMGLIPQSTDSFMQMLRTREPVSLLDDALAPPVEPVPEPEPAE